MTHRGKNSQKARISKNLRRYLKRKINQESYYDPIMAETICRTSREELIEAAIEFIKKYGSTSQPNLALSGSHITRKQHQMSKKT